MARPEELGVMYAIYPGAVTSKSDGQMHWVDARQLVQLYGVPPQQCAVVDLRNTGRDTYNLIPLHPRFDGDYSVARVIQEMPWE